MLSAIDIGIYFAICAVLLYFSIKGNAGFNYPRLQFFVKSIDKNKSASLPQTGSTLTKI